VKIKSVYSLLLFLQIALSCDKSEIPPYPYEAKVIGVNQDCGIYEIQFMSKLDEIKEKFGPTLEGIYIGKNLPDELEEENLLIQLDCRLPAPGEKGICTMMGPTYTWIYITNAKKK
jgi:hypothetical protein